LPEVRFPGDWDIAYTDDHWSNEKIVLPFIHKQKDQKCSAAAYRQPLNFSINKPAKDFQV